MASKITVEVAVPTGRMCLEDVYEVQLPGENGSFGVRAGHAALISTLGHGVLSLIDGNTVRRMAVHRGIAEVLPDRVRVLVDEATWAKDISDGEEIAALQAASHLMESGGPEVDYELQSDRVARAQARLQAHTQAS